MNETPNRSSPEPSAEETSIGSGNSRRRPPYLAIAAGTMLLVLALNGAWLLWSGSPVAVPPPPPIEDVLAKQIAAVVDGESDSIRLADRAIRDQDLEPLRDLPGLRTLVFDAGIITDAGMDVIASLPDLTHLRLRDSPLTDSGIALLRTSENLRVLNLPHANLSAKGVAELAELPHLRQLRIGQSRVEGAAAGDLSRGVAQLKHLRSVHLIDVPVTDEGLKQLASLPHLESLYLDGPTVTEAGWEWLFEHHPQLHVHLNQQHHDRDPAKHSHSRSADRPT